MLAYAIARLGNLSIFSRFYVTVSLWPALEQQSHSLTDVQRRTYAAEKDQHIR